MLKYFCSASACVTARRSNGKSTTFFRYVLLSV